MTEEKKNTAPHGHARRPGRRGPWRRREAEPVEPLDETVVVDEGDFDEASLADSPIDAALLEKGAAAVREFAENNDKIQKVLADAGKGSRRRMEELIEEDRVTVNGDLAYIGQRVAPGDVIRLDGKVVKRVDTRAKTPRVVLYNKPAGEIVSRDDPEGRRSVFEALPEIKEGRWISVGRLDYNSEGLLILTDNGALANRLMHPRYNIAREYAVRVAGELDEAARERLLAGVELEDGKASFSKLEEGGGAGLNHWYRVELSEGRNRQVRRMFAAVGLTVSRLVRVRHGDVRLPRDLAKGAVLELAPDAVEAWMKELGDIEPRHPAGKQPQGQRAHNRPPLGGRPGGKPAQPKQKRQQKRPQMPDPMTSTVHYMVAGKLPGMDPVGRARRRPKGGF